MKGKKTIGIIGGLVLLGGGTVVADNQVNPYVDKTSHYEMTVISDIPQNERVEISKIEPAITLSKWNNESRVTIKPQFQGGGTVSQATRSLLSKKMEFKKGDQTAFVEPKNDTDFDIDFTLDSKPASNVFTYQIIGAEDMDFFYQPALNVSSSTCTETNCGNMYRPENVVGSYAVYSKTKKNYQVGKTNYGTGKLFHIYRPKAIDAKGNEVWAELSYINGILTIVVPQKFLDIGIYPITIDPTLGLTTQGASNEVIASGSSNENSYASLSTMIENGTATAINVWANKTSANSALSLQIRSGSAGSIGSLVSGGSCSVTVNNTSFTNFQCTASVTASLVNATSYFIGASGGAPGPGSSISITFDSGGGANTGAHCDLFFAGCSYNTEKHGIYTTYTAAAVPPPIAGGVGRIQSGVTTINSGVTVIQ